MKYEKKQIIMFGNSISGGGAAAKKCLNVWKLRAIKIKNAGYLKVKAN